jgi:hypothetical protein
LRARAPAARHEDCESARNAIGIRRSVSGVLCNPMARPNKKTVFAEKLAVAIEEVTGAEKGLASVLRKLRAAPRAEKTTISAALEEAFARLKVARKNLVELQKLSVRDKD